MRKFFVALACISMLVFLASCGGSSGSDGGDDNTAPVAQITSPADGAAYTVGDTIQFEGSATDTEDGVLSGASLVWASDIDGQVGTGGTCSSDGLSPGAHQITLSGTDSGGAAGMDTVLVNISGNLPDTGQTTSYTTTFGEDGDYEINPPSYTKLDASGSELDARAADWVMVRDDVTGLIWEVKSDDGGIHDTDNTYTWQDAQDVFVGQLNFVIYGGYNDWRMPTIKELSSLVNADTYEPAIDTALFPNTMLSRYWSSTTYTGNTSAAWYVDFTEGAAYTFEGFKTNSAAVRAVRGGHLPNHLIDNGDGTVTDASNGLIWQQSGPGSMDWESALTYCENLDLSGFDNWRLPNRNELLSTVV